MWTLIVFGLIAFMAFVASRFARHPSDPARVALQMADLIRREVAGTSGIYEWDDLMAVPVDDETVEQLRVRATEVLDLHSDPTNQQLDSAGKELLLKIAADFEALHIRLTRP